jgi:hypothetical protein
VLTVAEAIHASGRIVPAKEVMLQAEGIKDSVYARKFRQPRPSVIRSILLKLKDVNHDAQLSDLDLDEFGYNLSLQCSHCPSEGFSFLRDVFDTLEHEELLSNASNFESETSTEYPDVTQNGRGKTIMALLLYIDLGCTKLTQSRIATSRRCYAL